MRGTRRTRIVIAVLLLVSVTLIGLDVRAGGGGLVGKLRRTSSSVLGPVERVAASALAPFRRMVDAFSRSDADRIRALQEQNMRLRLQLAAQPELAAQSAQLARLLHTAGLGQFPMVFARVMAIGPAQGFEWTAQLDAGAVDGVKVGMTVIDGSGLVGRITAVTSTTCTVLLAIDNGFTVGGRVAGSGQAGFVTGRGPGLMTFELLGTSAALRPGARLVTLGNDPGFTPGVPIGVVTTVQATPGALTLNATVRPYVSFLSLDLLGIVISRPRTDPRDALLPPLPTPSARPTPSASASPAASGSPTATPGASGTPGPGASPGPSASGSG